MTKREIGCCVSKLTGCIACNVDVDLICYDANVRPFDIESITSISGYLVLYLKGSWTVHADNTKVKLKCIYHYIKSSVLF